MNESEYSQGICEDGAAILRDGQPMTVEEILDALRDSEKLQAEVERLREHNDELQRYNLGFAESELRFQQERDQLKAAVALAVDAFKRYEMDVEAYPTTEHIIMMRNLNGVLAAHDAEVIEREIPVFMDPSTNNGDLRTDAEFRSGWNSCRDAMTQRANQLRQQAKEVQS